MQLILSKTGVQALWHCLQTVQPKGRTEIRNHAKVTRAIKTQCTEGTDQSFKEKSEMELDEDRIKYVTESARELVNKGVPGGVAEGYDELLDAIDAAEKTAEKKPAADKK